MSHRTTIFYFLLLGCLVILPTSLLLGQVTGAPQRATIQQLLNCLRESSIEDSSCFDQGAVINELLRRKPVDKLLTTYTSSSDSFQTRLILQALLYHISDAKVAGFMRKKLDSSAEEGNYYAAMYLAKTGDTTALSILNRHFWQWQVSSWQLATTAKLFGKFKFRPAIENLIKSVDAASLNLVEEALASLKRFYPRTPTFTTLEDAKKYYQSQRH